MNVHSAVAITIIVTIVLVLGCDNPTLPLSSGERKMILSFQDSCNCKVVYQHDGLIKVAPEHIDTTLLISFFMLDDSIHQRIINNHLYDDSAAVLYARMCANKVMAISPYIGLYRKIKVVYFFHRANDPTQTLVKSYSILFRIRSKNSLQFARITKYTSQ